MGLLLAFAFGYSVGAKAGTKGFEELVESIKAIQKSEEVADALKALRSHARHVMQEIAELLGENETPDIGDLLERVRKLAS